MRRAMPKWRPEFGVLYKVRRGFSGAAAYFAKYAAVGRQDADLYGKFYASQPTLLRLLRQALQENN